MQTMIKLTQEELQKIIKDSIKESIKAYKKEEENEKKKEKYHDTFRLMKVYRDVAIHVEKSISEAQQLEISEMTDEQQELYINSIRTSKIRSMLMGMHIDVMLAEIRERRKKEGREEEFKAFEMYFFDGMTYEKIAEELNCGKNTPRRWVNCILNELSPLLWGYDALKNW